MPGYQPDSSQAAQQYAAPAVVKTVIDLANRDRSGGELRSEIEGDYLYVEQADYPVLLSPITANTSVQQSFVARNGLTIPGPIKGLYVTHPLLTQATLQSMKLVLVQARGGCERGEYVNQEPNPVWGSPASINVITNTALSLTLSVAVPLGAKYLKSFAVFLTGTTVTQAAWQTISDDPTAACLAPSIAGYTSSNLLGGNFTVQQSPAGGTHFQLLDGEVPLPQSCRFLQLTVVGTGMSFPNLGECVRAVFQ